MKYINDDENLYVVYAKTDSNSGYIDRKPYFVIAKNHLEAVKKFNLKITWRVVRKTIKIENKEYANKVAEDCVKNKSYILLF